MPIGDFYRAAEEVVRDINAFARKHGLVGVARADHLSYKCASAESFEVRRRALEPESLFIHQANISARRIAYLRLRVGVGSAFGMINFLELSDQKPGSPPQEGFDHCELYPVVGTYAELVERLERGGKLVVKVERPHHTTHDIKLPSGFLIRLCQEPLVEKIKREEM